MSFTSAPSGPRWRDVYLAATARGITVCGDFLAATALALALQTRGAGGMAVAGVMLASAVPLMLLAPVAGRLADRMDSRMLLTSAGVLQVTAALALAYTTDGLAMIALAGVVATGLALSSPTLGALVPDMVGRDLLPKATAYMSTAGALGMLVAPAVAGILVGQFGTRVPLLVSAATYLANIAAAFLLRTRRGGRVATADQAAAAALAPAWRLRADTLLVTLMAGVAVTIAAVTAVNVADVFFTRETLHASTTMYGLLLATWTATMLVGAWLAARIGRRSDDGRLSVILLGLLGATSVVILTCSTVQHVLWLVPLFVIGGIFNGAENVIGSLVVSRRVPAAVRGRAIGAFVGTINAANVIGFVLGGLLLAVLAPRSVLALAGVAGVVAVFCCIPPLLRAIRREPRATGSTPAPAPVEVAV